MSICKHCGEGKLPSESGGQPTCARLGRHTLDYYEWFEVMKHLEPRYPGIEKRLWEYAQGWGVWNSIYLWIDLEGIETTKQDRKDVRRLAKAIGVAPEDGAIFHISW